MSKKKSYTVRPSLQLKHKYYIPLRKDPFTGLYGSYNRFLRHGRKPVHGKGSLNIKPGPIRKWFSSRLLACTSKTKIGLVNCCWSSQAQPLFVLSLEGLTTICHCLTTLMHRATPLTRPGKTNRLLPFHCILSLIRH
jgi:hypothetical protein